VIRACLLVLSSLLLAACADAPVAPPRIERISAEQLEARLPAPAAALPLDQVVALAKQGIAAEEIIARITASASRYRLSAGQVLEMAQQGVPTAVLDHLIAAERRQIFDEMAAELNRRDQTCRDRLDQEARACRNQFMGPLLMPGPYPLMNCFPLGPGSPYWRCL
jgi:hypothetical protein